jgi:hypothetical protein
VFQGGSTSGDGLTMTLVLSCITPDFVVQVSDRRLTKLDGSLDDDETNKAVLFLGHFVFAYTGLAYVGQTRTDRWLVDRLASAFQQSKPNIGAAIGIIATEASQAFQRISGRERKRHEFVAVGWGTFQAEPDRLRPSILRLSNTLDETGNWLPQAKRHFELIPTFLQNDEPFGFLASGQKLSDAEEASIRRNLGRSLAHGRGPGAVARLLTTLVRIVASRNTRVGKSMLINVLPIRAVGKQGASGVPTNEELPLSHLSSRTEEATFLYVAADHSPRSYGPNAVFEQVSFRDVQFSTDPSDYPLGPPTR